MSNSSRDGTYFEEVTQPQNATTSSDIVPGGNWTSRENRDSPWVPVGPSGTTEMTTLAPEDTSGKRGGTGVF